MQNTHPFPPFHSGGRTFGRTLPEKYFSTHIIVIKTEKGPRQTAPP